MCLKKYSILFIFLFIQMWGENLAFGIKTPENQYSNQPSNKNAGQLVWSLWGYRPNVWKMNFDFNQLSGTWAEYQNIPISIPGSVQQALMNQDIVPDWNIGLNSIQMEWIENRHWIIATQIPDNWIFQKENCILHCKGLDHQGLLFVNGQEVGRFNNAFIPWSFNIAPFLKEKNNTVAFVFECPPNYLGQIGYTSQITDWKPRFYYGWDWVPRIVQIGIWDEVLLQTKSQNLLNQQIQVSTNAAKDKEEGELFIFVEDATKTEADYTKILLSDGEGKFVFEDSVSNQQLVSGISWKNLQIRRWFPNGCGDQYLYRLELKFFSKDGNIIYIDEKKVGFKHVEWLPNKGSPQNADPWICSINNQPLFIQGVNWTPLRPNFADLKKADYKKILSTYKNLGINTIRIWGGGFAEKEWLYERCDELGILIWQDFPISSSGLDNYPPDDAESIAGFSEIARHYVNRLKNHVSLLLWCGGNELYEKGDVKPVDQSHPLISTLEKIIKENDPDRRFVPGSPSGPSIYASPENFGKGVHWDTHGPWKLPFGEKKTMDEVTEFWKQNDSFLFSEVGVPGAMQASLIEKYSGNYPPLPASLENPIWRTVNWWNEWDEYLAATSKNKRSLKNYVRWSQERQAEGLSIALKASKEKFPACGGFLIWMGHDCFPCMVNTAIIDFEGNPKPAAARLSKIWKNNNNIFYSINKNKND